MLYTSTCRSVSKSNRHYLPQYPILWRRFKSSASAYSAEETSSGPSSSSSDEYGIYKLLNPKERHLLAEQRQLTVACRQLVSQVGASTDIFQSASFLGDFHLESSFTVVVAGEFNAGKSTLINALLGTKLLESGALPTTDSITIVAKKNETQTRTTEEQEASNDDDVSVTGMVTTLASSSSSSPSSSPPSSSSPSSPPLGVLFHSVPNLPLLEDLTLVDTPGTNAVWMDHTVTTLRLLPAADLILFVTSADRPFPDSERTLLRSIQAYRKSIIVVVNKMDILDTSGGDHGIKQKQQIVDFVAENASELLGARPVVIPVSSRDALSAKVMGKRANRSDDKQEEFEQLSNVWHRSNFQALETFLKETLTAEAKLKSKLTSPIGLVDSAMSQCLNILKGQRKDLEADVATLNILQSQFLGWEKEMSAELARARMEMTGLVAREGQRLDVMLEQIQLYQFYLWTLTDAAQLHKAWEDAQSDITRLRAGEGLEEELLEHVKETADSVATRGRAQGQAVIEYLGKRPAVQNHSLVGSVTAASRFEDTRRALTEQLTQAVQFSLKKGNDGDSVKREYLFQSLRQAALGSAALHAGACTSILAMAVQLLDPLTALAATSTFFMGGGITYFVGTSRIRSKYQDAWNRREKMLDDSLRAICEKELDRVNRRILDGVAPYTRFVQREQERIDELQEHCEGVSSVARNLRNKINKLD